MNLLLTMAMQQADTVFLVILAVCAAIIVDGEVELGSDFGKFWCKALSTIVRVVLAIIGIAALFQAAWLQGYWIPSPAGYPWARVVVDGGLASLFLIGAIVVFVRRHRARVKRQRLQAR